MTGLLDAKNPMPSSLARDHLSNEMTFLAWMRTSLALIGISIGLLKWEGIDDALGYYVALLGAVVLLSSSRRYYRVMKLLNEGRFEPNVKAILLIVSMILVCMADVLGKQIFWGL